MFFSKLTETFSGGDDYNDHDRDAPSVSLTPH